MDLGLAGRTYVVTGASSGVGLATVAMLLAEGANVAACARDGARLEQAIGALAAPSSGTLLRSCDVVDQGAVDRFVADAVAAFGGVDGVVNNAGGSLMRPLFDTTDEQWRVQLELKIFSVLNPVRAAVPSLRKAEQPSIVNVNAILARQPESRLSATAAARAAVLNLSTSLARELAEDGIRVNSVLLGLIDTGQWRRRYQSSGTDQTYGEWTGRLAEDRGISLGRLGEADEVAFPIVSLLSPRSSYITGATLDVGGGVGRYV